MGGQDEAGHLEGGRGAAVVRVMGRYTYWSGGDEEKRGLDVGCWIMDVVAVTYIDRIG